MKIIADRGDALRTVFPCPATPLSKFAKVNGVLAALAAQDSTSITFTTAPAALSTVEIFYGNDIVIPPAVRTVSGASVLMLAPPADKGLTLFLSVTAGTGTLDCKVQQLDEVSGQFFDVAGAAFAQVVAVSQAALTIFPGAAPVAGVSINQTIRNRYRVSYAITGAGFTFSVGAQTF